MDNMNPPPPPRMTHCIDSLSSREMTVETTSLSNAGHICRPLRLNILTTDATFLGHGCHLFTGLALYVKVFFFARHIIYPSFGIANISCTMGHLMTCYDFQGTSCLLESTAN